MFFYSVNFHFCSKFILMEIQTTDRLELAAHFVNSTNSPIFLTGKAGTGKTTFLRNLAEITHKTYVILAPTGIAALHAKGVTIHSQFLLPFGSFLPTREPEGNFTNSGNYYTQYSLGRRHTLNSARKKVLKSVELLIIDEVSMLRADVLDAIDYRMKSVKRNFDEPFGGVQVLMIGDLFQLPPIVKDDEWQVLGKFYKSMHFFEAKALQSSGLVYIELNKIFRQKDDQFIQILNHLRENKTTQEDISFLNRFFKTEEEIKNLKDNIIITTHNYKAEAHNQKELGLLKGKSHFFEAEVKNEFPESIYPIPKKLELKEGAQVMFIKNDSSGFSDFFNGKMAVVKNIVDDEIKVMMTDTKLEYILKKETWENKRYGIKEETKELQEEVIGTFEQYPIKLAWAVTVHKSQGLTFDKAIIDIGQAFAPGQVYVALSRLRGLEGLTLRTRIQSNIISSDHQAIVFTKQTSTSQQPLEILIKDHQYLYIQKLLVNTFDFSPIIENMEAFSKESDSTMEFEDPEMRAAISKIYDSILVEGENTYKFQRQLIYLLQQKEENHLLERLEKGSEYYFRLLKDVLKQLMYHAAEVERYSKTKTYLDGISEIEIILLKKLSELQKITFLVPAILNGEEIGKMSDVTKNLVHLRIGLAQEAKQAAKDNPKFGTSKTGKKKKRNEGPNMKLEKGETFEITYTLSLEGKSVEEIAAYRGLAESTIKGHLTKGIMAGKVDIFNHLSEELVKEISVLLELEDGELGVIREKNPGKYDFGTLRMVAAHLARY